MGRLQSGQMQRTVNPSTSSSMVRIHPCPPLKEVNKTSFFNYWGVGMKIFIYGDSNTWGYVPNINGYSKNAVAKRYPVENIWWKGLAGRYDVVVDGLCGRAINQENPWFEGRNSSKTIENDIRGNYDLVLIQLGTNDCKSAYHLSAKEITQNLSCLLEKIESICNAQILIISPAKIKEGNKITDKYYVDAEEKTIEIDKLYQELAYNKDYLFVSGLDLETGEDGEHFTKLSPKELGNRVENCIQTWLEMGEVLEEV